MFILSLFLADTVGTLQNRILLENESALPMIPNFKHLKRLVAFQVKDDKEDLWERR